MAVGKSLARLLFDVLKLALNGPLDLAVAAVQGTRSFISVFIDFVVETLSKTINAMREVVQTKLD